MELIDYNMMPKGIIDKMIASEYGFMAQHPLFKYAFVLKLEIVQEIRKGTMSRVRV